MIVLDWLFCVLQCSVPCRSVALCLLCRPAALRPCCFVALLPRSPCCLVALLPYTPAALCPCCLMPLLPCALAALCPCCPTPLLPCALAALCPCCPVSLLLLWPCSLHPCCPTHMLPYAALCPFNNHTQIHACKLWSHTGCACSVGNHAGHIPDGLATHGGSISLQYLQLHSHCRPVH